MNAAEITDKLGLHSLRQRAWVSLSISTDLRIQLIGYLVHPIYVRYFRRWSLRGFGVAQQLSPQGWTQLNALFSSISQRLDCTTYHNPPIEKNPTKYIKIHNSSSFTNLGVLSVSWTSRHPLMYQRFPINMRGAFGGNFVWWTMMKGTGGSIFQTRACFLNEPNYRFSIPACICLLSCRASPISGCVLVHFSFPSSYFLPWLFVVIGL